MNKIPFSQEDISYLAGFLDGDGSINAQIVQREDYKLKYQIRVSITLFQDTKQHWFLLQIQKQIGCGTIRKRGDGISEYAIVGKQNVAQMLKLLLPCLRLKRRQAELVHEICETLSKNQDPASFLQLCVKADMVGELNYSKKRTITASVVKQRFLELGLITDTT
uniref:Putative site-specific DNA endonuclease n=1 Tax=Closterium baillyanum TaxID=1416941 RepID=A0A191T615_9VIRI|nr:putative site-specific DNA endonuclease [Closterium baillyanum]YP_009256847.1 putative site-specific DNA endonuclease [Closterium baillyanum]ANI25812.1 putative site-specific DNA endonuclease [Closterium baillyanum]ANI25817.1 putative site-specific DNA endonuclease [Closterium baillyanum]